MRVSLFVPCFINQLFPSIGFATVRVLEQLGHTVDFPEGQTCCGQPAFNCGFAKDAMSVARHFIRCFADADVIVVPSGSCAAMIRIHYAELSEGTDWEGQASEVAAKTFELSEFLVDRLGVVDLGARLPGKAAYHDGCHGLRELGIRLAPRSLLRNVTGLSLIELPDRDSCCGFGGAFSVKFPAISGAMVEAKSRAIELADVDYLISGDASCLMQIQGYVSRQQKTVRCLHLAEVLAAR